MARRLRKPRRRWLALVGAGLLGLALLTLLPERAETLAGEARVVDGDTIAVAGRRIRLVGLDAPEARQTCTRAGTPWPCGAEATAALREALDGRAVTCTAAGRDRYDRILGTCTAGGQDVGAWMVREGWAVAYTAYSWRYLPEEATARWHGRGLWSGEFERPEDWRRRQGP